MGENVDTKSEKLVYVSMIYVVGVVLGAFIFPLSFWVLGLEPTTLVYPFEN